MFWKSCTSFKRLYLYNACLLHAVFSWFRYPSPKVSLMTFPRFYRRLSRTCLSLRCSSHALSHSMSCLNLYEDDDTDDATEEEEDSKDSAETNMNSTKWSFLDYKWHSSPASWYLGHIVKMVRQICQFTRDVNKLGWAGFRRKNALIEPNCQEIKSDIWFFKLSLP